MPSVKLSSLDQDPFANDRKKKEFSSMKFPRCFSQRVDMTKVSLEAIRPWLDKRVTQLLGREDDIVSEYCVNHLEAFDPVEKFIDPRRLHVDLDAFLGIQTAVLMEELWGLLLSAQENPSGVPQQIIDERRSELKDQGATRAIEGPKIGGSRAGEYRHTSQSSDRRRYKSRSRDRRRSRSRDRHYRQ